MSPDPLRVGGVWGRDYLDAGYRYGKCSCLYTMCSVLFLTACPCSCVSEALLLTLLTLSLTNNSSSDSKAFLCYIAFSGSPKAVHRPLHVLQYYTVGIPLIKDIHKCLSSTEKPQYHMLKSLNHTLPLHMCYGEVYGNIAREENG